ncbi:MAG TPA: hypothetical protein VFC79_12990, partial [Tissierellaceae bacterium]|nr:hypothetical protein [Tissierellaceae bacterium]
INNITRDVHIVQEGVRGLRLLCKPDEDIVSGEYVAWKSKEYLCTHRFPDDKVQAKGTIQFCNHYLKWIDKKTNELIIKPCVEDARTLYTTGIKDEELMEIPNGMVGIMLPYSDIVKRMDRDDRFVFNKTSYRVTFYDETTYPGLMALICQETGLSYLDDKVNEIAGRWVEINGILVDRLPHLDDQEPDEPPIINPEEPVEGVSYSIEIEKQYQGDTDYELSSNNWQKYTIKKLVNNEEVNGNFDFILSEDIEGLTLAKEADNSCKLSTVVVYGKYDVNLIVTDTDTNELITEQDIFIDGR